MVVVQTDGLFRDNGGWPDMERVHKGFAPLGGPVRIDADTVRIALQDLLLSRRLEQPLSHVRSPAARPSLRRPGASTDATPAGARLSIHPSLMTEPSPRDSESSYSNSFGTPSPHPGSGHHFQGMTVARSSEIEELPGGEEWQTSVSAFGTPEEEEEGARRAYVVLSGNGAGEGGAGRRRVSGSAGEESMYSASDAGLDSDMGSVFSLKSRFEVLTLAPGTGTSRAGSLGSRKETARPQQPGARDADEETYSLQETDESEMSSESGSEWSPGPAQMPRAKVTVSPDRSPPPAGGGLLLSPDWEGNEDADASGGTSEYGTEVSWAARSV